MSTLTCVLIACGGSDGSPEPRQFNSAKPETLNIVLESDPASLDPHKTSLLVENTLLMYLLTGLAEITPDGYFQPGVATSWETSDNGLTWIFDLRPDATWNDGVPLTAEDFVYSFRRAVTPATGSRRAEALRDIRNAEAILGGEVSPESLGVFADAPQRLRIELIRPNPYLVEILVGNIGMPVPRHVVERHGDAWVRPEHWVGNGTYTLNARVPNDRVELVSTHPEDTAFDQVNFYPISDAKVAYNRYRAGEVHAIPILSRDVDLTGFQNDLRYWPFSAIQLVGFNHATPPFDNQNVRRALALAVDQTFLAEAIAKPAEIPAKGFVPLFIDPAAPQFPEPPPNKLEEARKLLQEAGFSEENPLEFTFFHTNSISKTIPVALMGAWQEIGVKATLRGQQTAIHYAHLAGGDFGVALVGRGNPARIEEYLFNYTAENARVNNSRYRHAMVDQLKQDLIAEPDKERREAIAREIQKILIDDVAAIPLYFPRGQGLVRPEIEGWIDNPYNIHPLKNLSWSE